MIAMAVQFLAIFSEASYRVIEVPFRSYGKSARVKSFHDSPASATPP